MKVLKTLFMVVMLTLSFATFSHATVLTFDDIPGETQNWYGIIDSYGGYIFTTIGGELAPYNHPAWIDTVDSPWPYGSVSGGFTMTNNWSGNGKIVSSTGREFTFDGLYARMWGTAPSTRLNIEGYKDGTRVWSHDIFVTSSWTNFSGYSGAIDDLRLNFLSNGYFMPFLIDNLELSSVQPVPIPPSVWLLGTGLVGIVGLRRKFFRK